MTHQDENGGILVCTVTKAEREAQQERPVVHFVGHEARGWGDE